MNQFKFRIRILAFATCQLALLAQVGVSQSEAKRPNLLFILTDDQRWDAVGYAGNPYIQTPNIDRLAEEGVVFTNSFVTTSICAASRASIFTGLHERSHGYNFYRPPLSSHALRDSYPVALKRMGYTNGFVGKFGVKVVDAYKDTLFDYFHSLFPYPYLKELPDGSKRHLTDITGDLAIEFLQAQNGAGPWSLSISFNAPHSVDKDPQQYFWPNPEDGLYEDVLFPEPETIAPQYFADNPEFLKHSESRKRYHWRFDEPGKYQEMVRGYYRMISGVDRVIGRVLQVLEETGQEENTVIIFMSDNGYFLGERGLADKWYLYEPSVRVPLLVVDPRIPERDRRNTHVSLTALNIDIAPTLVDYAGGDPSALPYQGRSLRSLVEGTAPVDWRTEFYYEHLFHHDVVKIPRSEGVRDERWTYIRWIDENPVVEELYDHRTDFSQTNNLIRSDKHESILASLRWRTDNYRVKYEEDSYIDE